MYVSLSVCLCVFLYRADMVLLYNVDRPKYLGEVLFLIFLKLKLKVGSSNTSTSHAVASRGFGEIKLLDASILTVAGLYLKYNCNLSLPFQIITDNIFTFFFGFADF